MATAGSGLQSRTDHSKSAMDDMLAPIERTVKTYLTDTVSQDLIELLSILAVERPKDPHLWLAQHILAKSPDAKKYTIVETGAKR